MSEAITQEPWERDAGTSVHVFDGPEGKGKVGIKRGAYGLEIFVQGIVGAVASIDLFHCSEEGRLNSDRQDCVQVVIQDVLRDAMVCRAAFRKEGTRVDFENGVECLEAPVAPEVGLRMRDLHERVFGYPPEESEAHSAVTHSVAVATSEYERSAATATSVTKAFEALAGAETQGVPDGVVESETGEDGTRHWVRAHLRHRKPKTQGYRERVRAMAVRHGADPDLVAPPTQGVPE